MAILGPNGITYGDGSGMSSGVQQTSGWFHYEYSNTSGTSYNNSSWNVGQTTPTMNLPARAKVFVYTYTPVRGDTNNWGGHYEDFQYSINGGTWTGIGRSGFVSRMTLGGYNISKHTDFVVLDFKDYTSDFTLALRTLHLSYDSTGVLNSQDISSGSNTGVYNNNKFYKHMVIMGYAQAAA